jgi:hypothetical protein
MNGLRHRSGQRPSTRADAVRTCANKTCDSVTPTPLMGLGRSRRTCPCRCAAGQPVKQLANYWESSLRCRLAARSLNHRCSASPQLHSGAVLRGASAVLAVLKVRSATGRRRGRGRVNSLRTSIHLGAELEPHDALRSVVLSRSSVNALGPSDPTSR